MGSGPIGGDLADDVGDIGLRFEAGSPQSQRCTHRAAAASNHDKVIALRVFLHTRSILPGPDPHCPQTGSRTFYDNILQAVGTGRSTGLLFLGGRCRTARTRLGQRSANHDAYGLEMIDLFPMLRRNERGQKG